MKPKAKNSKSSKPQLESLLQQLIEVQQEQQESLINLNAALACLYKVKDNLFSFNFQGEDYTFYLPDLPYDFIQRAMVLQNSFFEVRLLEKIRARFLHPGMKVVEVGGNLGNHAVFFSKVAGAQSVISFEPQPHLVEVFKRNLELNQIENVAVRQALCGEKEGQGQIKGMVVNNLGATQFEMLSDSSSTPPPQQGSDPGQNGGYPVVTLDEEITDGCDFLKIDVEGMEEQVIKGALKLLERWHPVIMVELWDEEHVQSFVRHLMPYGYKSWTKFDVYDYVFTTQDKA